MASKELDPRFKKFDGDLLLTTACPVECDFCIYSCTASKEKEKWMPESTIRRVAEQYSKNDIGIRIGGGEPFYDLKKLERCIDILLEYYKDYEILVITSGFWAVNEENTSKVLKMLNSKGIDRLVVSVDKFHLKRVAFSNVKNIVENAKKYSIDIVLRITMPSIPSSLVEELAELVTKYDLRIETHGVGVVGRAEKIHVEADQLEKEELLAQKINEYGKKFNTSEDVKEYKIYCAKRSQTKFGSGFFPTTFPNGNVYGCSICGRLSYMGSINKVELSNMILRWKDSLAGYFNLSENGCGILRKFLPERFGHDSCDFCRNHPFSNNVLTEAVGRKFVKINMKMSLNRLTKGLSREDVEFLLSFRLTEEDLNKQTGKEIEKFLRKLKDMGIRFVLSRPLPHCLGRVYPDTSPKNCFECKELFTIEKGVVKYCDNVNKFGLELNQIKNRGQVYRYFDSIHKNMEAPNVCRGCIYYIREECNSLCYVK